MEVLNLQEIANQILQEGKTTELINILLNKSITVVKPQNGALGPIYRRRMFFENVGHTIPGHFHNYDHVTVLFSGAVLVKYYDCDENGEPTGLVSEAIFRYSEFANEILIRANTMHEFIALEPNTLAVCYFPHRDSDGKIVQEYNGNKFAYA